MARSRQKPPPGGGQKKAHYGVLLFSHVQMLAYQVLSRHFGWLFQTQEAQYGGRYIG